MEFCLLFTIDGMILSDMKRLIQRLRDWRKQAIIDHLEEKLRSIPKHQEWDRARHLHELIQDLKIIKQ